MQSSTMQSGCNQKLLTIGSKLNNIDLNAVLIFQNNKISDFKYPSDLNQTGSRRLHTVVVFECTQSGSQLKAYLKKHVNGITIPNE
jgi:hypothetical protein